MGEGLLMERTGRFSGNRDTVEARDSCQTHIVLACACLLACLLAILSVLARGAT